MEPYILRGIMKRFGIAWCVLPIVLVLSCSSAPDSSPAGPKEMEVQTGKDLSMTTQKDSDIDALVASMSLREKIAQKFITWIPADADTHVLSQLKGLGTAGYILYPQNFRDIDEVKDLTASLKKLPPHRGSGYIIEPFLCADQEGGRVSAFRFREFGLLPSAFMLGSLQDRALIEASARLNALQLAHLGINMNLAPVADIYDQGDETIIGDRSFGKDVQWVSEAVEAYVNGLKTAGIISTLKHYPGHGITNVDTHGALPLVYYSLHELRQKELIPFIRGIEAGAPVVMAAHILYPFIDPDNPASLSYTLITKLLREELDFDGIIISDGFEMGALSKNYSKEEALRRALNAGIDIILLYSSYDPAEMITLAEELVYSGELKIEAVDSSVRRILSVKQDYGLLWQPQDTSR